MPHGNLVRTLLCLRCLNAAAADKIYRQELASFTIRYICNTYIAWHKKIIQAGAELGQAQLKLGRDFTLFFCKFGFS